MLSDLPEALGQLQSLEDLDLGSNRLLSLPAVLERLPLLRVLMLGGNPLWPEDEKITEAWAKTFHFQIIEQDVGSIDVVGINWAGFRGAFEKLEKSSGVGELIPEKNMRTATIIALRQPIPLLLLVKLCGSGAFEHVKDLQKRSLVRVEGSGKNESVCTTFQFADMFGLSRDVEEMKAQLRAQLRINE